MHNFIPQTSPIRWIIISISTIILITITSWNKFLNLITTEIQQKTIKIKNIKWIW